MEDQKLFIGLNFQDGYHLLTSDRISINIVSDAEICLVEVMDIVHKPDNLTYYFGNNTDVGFIILA